MPPARACAYWQPCQISCSYPPSVSQLATAARHWRHAEEIRLPLLGLVIGVEDTSTLNSSLERALSLSDLHRLQLQECCAAGSRQFQVMLRNRLLEAPSLQVLHPCAAHVQWLPRQAFMQLRQLKLEVSESFSQGACTALCRVSSLEMLFLALPRVARLGVR